MACDPTAQPSLGPTIWIEASGGIVPGTAPEGADVGLAVGEGEALGVDSGVALAVGVDETSGTIGTGRPRLRNWNAPNAISRPAARTPAAMAKVGTVPTRLFGRVAPSPLINEPARLAGGFASRRNACA